MCGFLGQLGSLTDNLDNNYFDKEIRPIMSHRGPDNFDFYKEETKNLFLSHWRLSIIDLSINSNQPIKSSSNRFIMIFNGEIYNYKYLSNLLKKNKIKHFSNSDSSILINLFEIYDLDIILKKVEGMYAFVVFDQKENILYLCRDSFGEKPLYYFKNDKKIIFSSEIKGILKLLEKNKISLSLEGIKSYVDYGYFNNNKTVFQNIFALEPGTYIKIKNLNFKNLKNIKYFDHKKNIDQSNYNSLSDPDTAVNKLDTILNQAVEKTLVADVPIGLFLSGGIDSALISYYASKKISNLKSYTVSFNDINFDESERAKKISNYLGIRNHEIRFSSQDFLNVLNDNDNFFDQPFSDSSVIPMFFLSKIASKDVKVCLGGDGADEMFYGYENKYKFYKRLNSIPQFIKKILINIDQNYPLKKGKVKTLINYIKNDMTDLPKLLNKKIYLRDFTQIDFNNDNDEQFLYDNFAKDIKEFDIKNYLNSNILYKTDFSTMKNSLELRSPYLNKKIYSFSNEYNDFLYKNFKKINKKLFLKKFKDFNITSKKGFSVPLNSFLRGEMNAWMNDLIHSRNNDTLNIFNRDKLISFTNNKKSNLADIWPILIYMHWETKR